ncbi:diphthine--ammonia ligase [Bacillus infantis]|uniref:Dph6-related ATP pyrophosphatase n=1 Tax=Bacillus infantis TaxID=324767 RepID=UPI00101CAA0B|nr:diphthine--ammonia ligase [Bacillus infantis]RYI30360.1 diphthine--ammonia ligase [Bacillus infantis]
MKKAALSWSGGKDGCMALDLMVKKGIKVECLLTTVPKELGRTFGHGERQELISLQGEALGIPVRFIECTFDGYTDSFVAALKEAKKEYGLDAIAFGDLYLDEHRDWGEKAAAAAGLEASYPLWMKKEEAPSALEAFTDSGYKAKVIRIRDEILATEWLGREVDASFARDIKDTASCPMGEAGEYHTFVYDGPLFRKKVSFDTGEIIQLETTKRLELENFALKEKA